MADGGPRRSEAAALTWGDVELWADGTACLTIRKGKNQIEPQTVAVTAATTRALGGTLPTDVDPAAPVSGLTGEALANRVRAAAGATSLADGFSGHSTRGQGRWKNGDMVARYTRGEAAGVALKWLH